MIPFSSPLSFLMNKLPWLSGAFFPVLLGMITTWFSFSPQVSQGATAVAAGDLIKGSTVSVYYYAPDGKRYVFPTANTYFTWYTDFRSVKTVSDTQLGSIVIGGNASYRPGVKLIKVMTDPKVYAVSKGGVLRHITSEAIASQLYGSNWRTQVDDLPDTYFTNYTIGVPITSANDYNPTSMRAASPTIGDDKGLTATASSGSDLTHLPLGDGKISTSPQRGFIYLCTGMPTGRGGAQADGPWIQGSTWDLTKKAKVNGSVSWPNAFFSVVVNTLRRQLSGNALPSHATGIYPISSSDDAYLYDRNPNQIRSQTLNLSLPSDPTVTSSASCLGGEVGVALSGVAIFNGFDAGNKDAVAHEVQDDCSGHPQVSGVYHYHGPSSCVNTASKTETDGSAKLFGYALDGFGIYENQENGKHLTNADLDECHGHTHEVTWNGTKKTIYHYHLTNEFPYTVGCFKGTPVQRQVIPMQGGGMQMGRPF